MIRVHCRGAATLCALLSIPTLRAGSPGSMSRRGFTLLGLLALTSASPQVLAGVVAGPELAEEVPRGSAASAAAEGGLERSSPPVVADVRFPEAATFSERELLRWMSSRPASRRERRPFSRDEWQADLDRLLLFYRQEGFDEARVTGLVEELPAGDEVVLHVGIEEGPRWRWIRTGLDLAPQRASLRDSLEVMLPVAGEPARWRVLPRLRDRLLAKLRDAGHHDADVHFRVRRDPADRNAELAVVVRAGPRVRVEGIRVDGLEKTEPHVVMREIESRNGDVLLPGPLRRSERRLRALGVFEDVSVAPADSSHRPGFRAVVVSVVERPGGRIGAGFGYGSLDRLHLGATLGQANLGGRAIRGELNGVIGQQRRRLDAGAYFPWTLGHHVGLRVASFYEKEFPSRFSVERLGGELSLVREIDTRWKLEVGYVVQRVRRLASERLPSEERLQLGNLGVGLSRDTRNRLLGPTTGGYLRFSYDWVSPRLGSDAYFTRSKFQVREHARLGRGFLGSARALIGVLKSHDAGREIPLTERFFAGGTEDLRGFPGDGIGPADSTGTPVGGRILFLAGFDLERSVYRGLGLAAFLDVGQLEDQAEDLRARRLSVGAGAGFRLRSRLGFARADLGFPLTDRFADGPRFHFSTGTTFF